LSIINLDLFLIYPDYQGIGVQGIVLFSTVSRSALGTHQSRYPVGTWGSRTAVKLPGHEPDHSSPSSAEVKNVWLYISTPQYVFVAFCLIKHRNNFYVKLLENTRSFCPTTEYHVYIVNSEILIHFNTR
jgi:hypothetical protein